MTPTNINAFHEIAPAACQKCPRLVQYRVENQEQYPDKHNDVVPSFGAVDPEILIVGLAPGLQGANFTGRPFTGDYAGDLLYETLLKFGLASGAYNKHKNDGITLQNARITNAVRCVPPQNKPTPDEMRNCLNYLEHEIDTLPRLRVIIALGSIAHQAVLKCAKVKLSAHKFAHGAEHDLVLQGRKIRLIDSYHCSRYNTNTGRLTSAMFDAIFARVKSLRNREETP